MTHYQQTPVAGENPGDGLDFPHHSQEMAADNKFGRIAMKVRQNARLALVCLPLLFPAQANAQEAGAPNATPNPGRDMVVGKCFQCHNDSMFRDLRQNRRAWEGTIYRMIGRGGLWTQDEIKLMADFLGADYGPDAKPAAVQAR